MMRDNFSSVGQHQQHDRKAKMESIRRSQRALEARIRDLEKEKKEVSKELQVAEKSFQEHFTSPNSLTLSMFCGYTLTDFDIKEEPDNIKVFTASCKDNSHPFKVSIKIQGELVQAVIIMVPKNSNLSEIQELLDTLSEHRNPSLMLMTIEQFIHLNHFREKVSKKLISSSHKCIKVFSRQALEKEQAHTIRLYNNIEHKSSEIAAEILWSIKWDSAQQALTHELSVPFYDKAAPSIKKKLSDLQSSPATCKCEDTLWNWWEDLRLHIIRA